MTQGQAISRHLVFVLESGEFAVQRGANIVELIETGEQRVFNDSERDHNATDDELATLQSANLVAAYDDVTVWLPYRKTSPSITYYYLDTKLPPAYLSIISDLLRNAALDNMYRAKNRIGRVAIMGLGGEPFDSLPDAEHAYTLVSRVLAGQIADLSIETMQVFPTVTEDSQLKRPANFDDLIRQTPVSTLADNSVLIVEAEGNLAEGLQLALENLGIDVSIAQRGELALEILMDEEPDLLVIDLLLPDMHGYEIIANVRKDPLTAHTPIIAVSSYVSEVDMVFALNVARVDDYLVRPIGQSVLRNRVITLLNRRL